MDMVERVARAMAVRNNDHDEEGRLQWPAYADDARAAIAAMRVPSKNMLEAGNHEFRWIRVESFAEEVWQAMIDAALTKES